MKGGHLPAFPCILVPGTRSIFVALNGVSYAPCTVLNTRVAAAVTVLHVIDV